MDYLIVVAILIVVLILLLYSNQSKAENLSDKIKTEPIKLQKTTPKPFIKLYEEFNEKGLVFDFEPILEERTSRYLRKVLKVNLKSIDINVPKQNDGADEQRHVEIWSVYAGDNTASTESDFYNSFTEPDFAKKANPAKFKLITNAKAGERLTLNIMEPVKKIYIFARL